MRAIGAAFLTALGAATVLSATGPQPQQAPQTPPAAPVAEDAQQPVIRSGINFIRVDAIVTDRKTGKPVTDLTPADFEIAEEGDPQAIETFRLVDIDVPVVGEMADAAPIRSLDQQEREMQREDVRIVAILLDDYHVSRGADMAIREKLASFVLQLNSRDLVAIVYPLTPVTDLVFTRNHEAVAESLMRFQGRKFDYTPRNAYEERYSHYPAATVEMIRTQVTMSALRSLSIHMGTLREGRKTVLLVSEGMTYNLPPSITNPNDPNAPMPGMGSPMSSAGYTPSATEFFRSVDMASDLRYVFDAASRANTSVYTIDPRGMAVSAFGIEHNVGLERDRAFLRETTDWLRIMADETGGRAIVARNNFLDGLRQMLQDSSSYYLIGYNSTRSPTDGKFHEIKVRVKRPGVEVRARKGYWALTAESVARAEASADGLPAGPPPEVNEALSALAAPSRGRPAQTWIGTARAEDGRAQVSIVWEALAQQGRPASERAENLSVTASTGSGELLFRGRGDAQAATAGRAAGGVVTFTAAPGPVDLRIAIEGPGGALLDTDSRTITVPDYSGAGIVIGTPRVYRARTARDIAGLRADATARPVASREFSRAERLLLRFDVWGPGGIAPLVKARMLNMRGEPVTDLPAATPAAGGGYEIEVPLAPYAPNDYLIELTSGEGGDAVSVLTALRIL